MIAKKSVKEYTAYEKKLREYYWKCFVSEFSKVLLFFLVAIACGLVKEYFAALIFLMVLRNQGGGLHFKHYTTCLLVSTSFLFGSILLAFHFQPHRPMICISTLLCAFAGWYFAPITSSNRPAATPEQVKRSKRATLSILLFALLLFFICPLNRYLYIGFWTIILHIAQLAVAYYTKEVRQHA